MRIACEWLLRQVGVTSSGEDYCSTPFGLRLASCDWHQEGTLSWLHSDVNPVTFRNERRLTSIKDMDEMCIVCLLGSVALASKNEDFVLPGRHGVT